MIGQHKPVLIFGDADQSGPKGRLVGEIADRGAFGGTHLLDLLVEVRVAPAEVDVPPGHDGIGRDDLHRLIKLFENRAARWGCRVTTVRTASRRRCGSSRPLNVISSCTAYTSSLPCAVLA